MLLFAFFGLKALKAKRHSAHVRKCRNVMLRHGGHCVAPHPRDCGTGVVLGAEGALFGESKGRSIIMRLWGIETTSLSESQENVCNV